MMLHYKHQCSRHSGFRREYFFPIYAYVKHVTLAGDFWPKGHNLYTLGRGLLGDATYKISKALGLVVSDKKSFSMFYLF